MKIKLLLFAFTMLSSMLQSQITVGVGSEQTPLNPYLLGLNGRSTEGPSWTNSTFKNMVAEMNPAYVRYPAGTQGNKWNWKTGNFIPGHGSSSYTYTIPMLINGLPSRTKIIYMVNMVLPTPQTGISFSSVTDEILKTEETLQAKIKDMLDALKEFGKYNHLPDAVELDNELYFSNEEAGVYAADPVFYMAHAKKITQAIKAVYPDIKILICTTKGGTRGRDNWNNNVFSILRADNAFSQLVYAVVQHHYINDKYGYLDPVTDNATAETIVGEGLGYVADITSDYEMVPENLQLWITEFGATKRTTDGMWASGLRTANMILGFMQLGVKVDNLIWQHITDNPNVINTTYLKTGPAGMAISLLNQAMVDKTSYSKLQFEGTDSGQRPIYGFKFSNNDEESILLINQGNASYLRTDLSGLFNGSEVLYARQYWSESLVSSPVYNGSSTINSQGAKNLLAYNIRPYSITAIRVKKGATSLETGNKEKLFRVFHSTTNNELTIKATSEVTASVRLSNLTAKTVFDGQLRGTELTIPTHHLPAGIYLLSVQSGKHSFTQKIIRF